MACVHTTARVHSARYSDSGRSGAAQRAYVHIYSMADSRPPSAFVSCRTKGMAQGIPSPAALGRGGRRRGRTREICRNGSRGIISHRTNQAQRGSLFPVGYSARRPKAEFCKPLPFPRRVPMRRFSHITEWGALRRASGAFGAGHCHAMHSLLSYDACQPDLEMVHRAGQSVRQPPCQ